MRIENNICEASFADGIENKICEASSIAVFFLSGYNMRCGTFVSVPALTIYSCN